MGYFGNNFGNNWTYSAETVSISPSPSGSRQQVIQQPFHIFTFNTVIMGVSQEHTNTLQIRLFRDTLNSFMWSLIGYLKNPIISVKKIMIEMKGCVYMKNSIITNNFYTRNNSVELLNTIQVSLKPLSEFLLAKLNKLKKLKEIVGLLSVGTASEVTTVVYNTVGSTDERFAIDDECDDYDGLEWNVDDPDMPILPIHPNCKCFWTDGDTGENLGQDLTDYGGDFNDTI